MKSPGLKPFLNAVGHIVHHLNTIAIGVSAVESGLAAKPAEMDISWNPSNLVASSRGARVFALRATIVFLAEEFVSYLNIVLGAPVFSEISIPNKRTKRLRAISEKLDLPVDELLAGPLLVIQWRNRIVHKRSRARLSKAEERILKKRKELLGAKYKNLDPLQLLQHFKNQTPTLKDVSSLIAMTINCVKRIDASIPAPRNSQDVMQWLAHLKLAEQLDRVKRISAPQNDAARGVENFLKTQCPELQSAYLEYCLEAPSSA
jgi:hypothetical protein